MIHYSDTNDILSTLKPSWNPAGVEPGTQEGPGRYDLWLVLVLIIMPRFVRDNGTDQTKEWIRGRKPASKKLVVRIHYETTLGKQHVM